jgi:hypothetical protein
MVSFFFNKSRDNFDVEVKAGFKCESEILQFLRIAKLYHDLFSLKLKITTWKPQKYGIN